MSFPSSRPHATELQLVTGFGHQGRVIRVKQLPDDGYVSQGCRQARNLPLAAKAVHLELVQSERRLREYPADPPQREHVQRFARPVAEGGHVVPTLQTLE